MPLAANPTIPIQLVYPFIPFIKRLSLSKKSLLVCPKAFGPFSLVFVFYLAKYELPLEVFTRTARFCAIYQFRFPTLIYPSFIDILCEGSRFPFVTFLAFIPRRHWVQHFEALLWPISNFEVLFFFNICCRTFTCCELRTEFLCWNLFWGLWCAPTLNKPNIYYLMY